MLKEPTPLVLVKRLVLNENIHPDYRALYIEYCEARNFKKVIFTDKNYTVKQNDDMETPAFKRAKRRMPTPIIEAPTDSVELQKPEGRDWESFESDVLFDEDEYRFRHFASSPELAHFPRTSTERKEWARINKPSSTLTDYDSSDPEIQRRQLRTLETVVGYDADHFKYWKPKVHPEYKGGDGSYTLFIPGVVLKGNLIKTYTSVLKKRADASGVSYLTESWKECRAKGYWNFVCTPVIEGINYGAPSDNIKEIGGISYLQFNNNNVFFCADTAKDAVKTAKFLHHELNRTPIQEHVFKDLFYKSFVNEMSEKLKKSERVLKRLRNQLALESARYGETIFTYNAVQKSASKVLNDLVVKIKSLPDLEEFSLNVKGFSFKTKEIFIELDDKRYYCGVFSVSCHIFQEKQFEFYNLASPSATYVTPHGDCAGTFQETLNSCLRNMDYYSLILTFLRMLKSVNPDDSISFNHFKTDFMPFEERPKKTYAISSPIEIYTSTKERDNENDDDNEAARDDDIFGNDEDDDNED